MADQPIVVDQNGNEWWTLEEAARRWGVRPRRVYKWIRGRTGSKGRRRLANGDTVQVYSTARRRLFGKEDGKEIPDYHKIKMGREVRYLIRPQPYPAPLTTPLVRPEGIHQGERRSTISYEANKQNPEVDNPWLPQDQYRQQPEPFVDPFPVPESTVFVREKKPEKPKAEKPKAPSKKTVSVEPVVRKKGEKKPEKKPAAPKAPEPEVIEAEAPELPLAEEKALLLLNMLRGQLADATGRSARSISNADIVAALRERATSERTTAREWVKRRIVPALVSSLRDDEEETWTRSPREVVAVEKALVLALESIGSGLDGVRGPRRRMKIIVPSPLF